MLGSTFVCHFIIDLILLGITSSVFAEGELLFFASTKEK
ncbi:LOW QUALITY PROTEIN: hypothetical protein SC1083_1776 [Aggregatibacter actinomycetemcomitans serotype e str. SC1083]|uniref:Uncharacterized protein n=1 Tax=Aggregatibacter actinomycetemcomitans serotype e str. SC1083 TaxID=907488 RepID=G4AAA3_AGGAC|nr:LOW QUALITY PROTEIN: hypothetical protein SC1083_1776 [Aggregatibacter actinomycetemcomitans serotype e str. SC1083]